MSDISLFLDQDNELTFNVSIEGTKPGTPKYRLVFETKDVSYAFNGTQTAPGEVTVVIPNMKNILREGNYRGQLEVTIDDRFFAPLQFDASFEQSVRVVAEHASRIAPKKVGVTASIVSQKAPAIVPAPVVEAPQRPVQAAPAQTPVIATKKTQNAETIAEVDGRPITADDLRTLIRNGMRSR
jgi:hypothetical protein